MNSAMMSRARARARDRAKARARARARAGASPYVNIAMTLMLSTAYMACSECLSSSPVSVCKYWGHF